MKRRFRVLVIGVGSIGERHLRCFSATGRADLAFCEIDPSLRATISERYSVQDTFENYEVGLQSQPDVVVVATPAHLHIPMAIQAVQSGAHVLIEKPLSTKMDRIDELINLTRQRQTTVGVAYVYRSHPVLSAMRTALKSDRFGEPLQIIATCGQHFPFYRPAYRETYYCSRSTGGGAVQDALTHIINATEWLVGFTTHVVADADHLVLEDVNVEDTVHVLTRHNSVMGCYSLNQHQAPNETVITVVCREGTVRFEVHNNRWLWQTEPGGTWTQEDATPLERDELFIGQANAFLDAVEHQTDPVCGLEAAKQTLRVNLAILSSIEKERWVNVFDN